MKIEIPSCLEDPAKELATPVFKEAGTTIGDLWFLIFGGISQKANLRRVKYAYESEKYRKKLEEELNAIPEEKRIEPNTQVVMNALTDSQSCVEEETLRNMFAKLIASASNADKASRVHPAFSGIIKQLGPADAKMLQVFKSNQQRIPIVTYRAVHSEGSGYVPVFSNIFIPTFETYCSEEQGIAASCFEMCGLVTIDYSTHLTDSSQYTPFETLSDYLEIKRLLQQKPVPEYLRNASDISIKRGIMSLTGLGRYFVEVCL